MIRYFCDGCGKELENGEHERLAGRVRVGKAEVLVEVISGKEATWNEGNVCHRCIITAIMALKDAHPSVSGFARKDGEPVNYSTSWSLNGDSEKSVTALFKGKA